MSLEDNIFRIWQLGGIANQIISTRNNPQCRRVYHTKGLAPALNTAQGGGRTPYIVVGNKYEKTDTRNN